MPAEPTIELSPEDRATVRQIVALCELADANFPADCDITVSATGPTAGGSIRMKSYRLMRVLKDCP